MGELARLKVAVTDLIPAFEKVARVYPRAIRLLSADDYAWYIHIGIGMYKLTRPKAAITDLIPALEKVAKVYPRAIRLARTILYSIST